MELKQELEFFNSHKEEYLKHYTGQFALVKDKELIGTYTTWEEAFNDGIERFGNVQFLIRPIQEEDEIIQLPTLLVGAININA